MPVSAARVRLVAVAPAAPYRKHISKVPISEASGHLDEIADESAATGEVIYLTRDGRRLAAIVPVEVAAEIEAAEDAADTATSCGSARQRCGSAGIGVGRSQRGRAAKDLRQVCGGPKRTREAADKRSAAPE